MVDKLQSSKDSRAKLAVQSSVLAGEKGCVEFGGWGKVVVEINYISND